MYWDNNSLNITNFTVQIINLGNTNDVRFQMKFTNESAISSCWYDNSTINQTNTSVTGSPCVIDVNNTLNYSGYIQINDTSSHIASFPINFSITNNSYIANNLSSTDSLQYFSKNDSLTNYANSNFPISYNITHYTLGSMNTYNGTNFQATVANGSSIALYSNYSGNWITPTPIMDGLVSAWSFAEGKGMQANDPINWNNGTLTGYTQNNGTLINNPTWQTGTNCKQGSCLSFDGSNDFVNISHSSSLNITSNFTISAWIKPNDMSYSAGRAFVVTKWIAGNDVIWLAYDRITNKLTTYLGGTTSPGWHDASTNMTVNTWNHILITFNNTHITLYTNGVASSAVLSTGPTNSNTGAVLIGGRDGGSASDQFNGSIDSVRIWNRSLSASEISSEYNSGSGTAHATVKPNAAWEFDEGAGTNAEDTNPWTQSKVGASSAGFDGVDDYINIPDSASINTSISNMSVSFWYKALDQVDNDGIVSRYQNGFPAQWKFSTSGTTSLAFSVYNSSGTAFTISPDSAPTITNWNHYVGIWNGTHISLYVNGASSTTAFAVNTATLQASNSPVWIGCYYGNANCINGSIDEVMIFNRSLNASEIIQLYQNGQYSQNTSGTQNASRNDFNGTYSFAASSVLPGLLNFTYNVTTTPILNGSCTSPTWISSQNGTYNAFSANMIANISSGLYADCINDSAFSSFTVKGTPIETNQNITRSAIWSSLWGGGNLASIVWNSTNDTSACWSVNSTSGSDIIAGLGTNLSANVSGDCISSLPFNSFSVLGTPIESNQNITRNNTVGNLDTDYTWTGVAWNSTNDTSTCWTSQQMSGIYTLSSINLSNYVNMSGDCINDTAWLAFAVNGTPTESSQRIFSTKNVSNLDTDYSFNGVAFSNTSAVAACWTTNQTSGTYNLASSLLNITINRTGDCVNDGAYTSFSVFGTPTQSLQTITRSKTITTNDGNYTFNGVVWTPANDSSACWTSNTSFGGTYNLATSTVNVSFNMSGDCISELSFNSFSVLGTPIESNQNITQNNTVGNLDTDYTWSGVAWNSTNDTSTCWTSQQMSGTYSLSASNLSNYANMSGDCVQQIDWSSFTVKGISIESNQNITASRTITNLDTDYSFNSLVNTTTNDTSTCWTSQTSLSFNYNLASSVLNQTINMSGDCINEGAFGAFTVAVANETGQKIQRNNSISNLDTDYTWSSVAWNSTNDTSTCWTSQELNSTYNLAGSLLNMFANVTGDCVNDTIWPIWIQNTSTQANQTYVQIWKNRSISNLDTDYNFTNLNNVTTNHSNICLNAQGSFNLTYNLSSTMINQTIAMSGDCVNETAVPTNRQQNTTLLDYVRNTTSWLYLFGNVSAQNLLTDINLTNIIWNWTDSNIDTNFTESIYNKTFNITNGTTTTIDNVQWRVNMSVNESVLTGLTWTPDPDGILVRMSDDPYVRTSAVRFAYNYTTWSSRFLYKCNDTNNDCDTSNSSQWQSLTFSEVNNEIQRTGDNMSNLTYLLVFAPQAAPASPGGGGGGGGSVPFIITNITNKTNETIPGIIQYVPLPSDVTGLFRESITAMFNTIESVGGGLITAPSKFACAYPSIPFTNAVIQNDLLTEHNCKIGAIMSLQVDRKIPIGAIIILFVFPILAVGMGKFNAEEPDKLFFGAWLFLIIYNIPLALKLAGVA